MSKAIVNMTNWQLYVYNGIYSLSGTADHHPSLGKNTYITRTSYLVNYTFEDDVLTYETRNTIYVCPLKYMSPWLYRNVVPEYRKELTTLADKSDSILDKIISAAAKLSIEVIKENYKSLDGDIFGYHDEIVKWDTDYSDDEMLKRIRMLQESGQSEIKEMKEKEHYRLVKQAEQYENCVYIEVSNVECGSLLAYHLGNDTGVVEAQLHSGMFQDSVLYMKYRKEDDDCGLDFRYFPKGWGSVMETYSWSDNIQQAVIKNDTDGVLFFNEVEIPIGETMIFTPDNHKQGLISPDCYNGKSCLVFPEDEE